MYMLASLQFYWFMLASCFFGSCRFSEGCRNFKNHVLTCLHVWVEDWRGQKYNRTISLSISTRTYNSYIQHDHFTWILISNLYTYVTRFGKTDLMEIIVDSSYGPKYTLDQHTMVFQISTLQKNIILCLLALERCPHLCRRNVSFGPLVPSLIACNREMLTWCQDYHGNDSGSTSVGVLATWANVFTRPNSVAIGYRH